MFVGLEQDYFWECLERISTLSDEQKSTAKNLIKQRFTYSDDLEDMYSLFLTPKKWFPTRFWSLDTSVRDRAIDIMKELGICKIINGSIVV